MVLSVITLALLALSKYREYAAARAATMTGDPLALVRALRKVQRRSEAVWGLLSLLYVQTDERDRLRRLLATHPPTEERVRRLLERANEERRSAAASFGP